MANQAELHNRLQLLSLMLSDQLGHPVSLALATLVCDGCGHSLIVQDPRTQTDMDPEIIYWQLGPFGAGQDFCPDCQHESVSI